MAASGAMIVSGLDKELKPKSEVVIKDPKANLKELDEYILKLTNTTPLDQVKKWEQKNTGGKKEEERKPARFKAFYSPSAPAEPFEWNKKGKSGNFILDFFLSLQHEILKRVLFFALNPELNELSKLAEELNINTKGWNLEKFHVGPDGEAILSSDLTPEEKKILLLKEELKILIIGEILEDEWVGLLVIKLRKNYVLKTLIGLNVKIEELIISAKQIAWLKLIAELKAMHLKRVFCGSKKDFDSYSKVILNLTQKIRKIDLNLPGELMNLVKTHLEKLALETAVYKLELLRSLQKISPDKAREKDIKWLESTAAHLKHV